MIMNLREIISNPDQALGKKAGEKGKDTEEGESSGVKGKKSLDLAKSRAATPEEENAPTQSTSLARKGFVDHFMGSVQRNLPRVSPEQDRGYDEGDQAPKEQSSAQKGKRRRSPDHSESEQEGSLGDQPLAKRRKRDDIATQHETELSTSTDQLT